MSSIQLILGKTNIIGDTKYTIWGHSTHEIEGPWSLHSNILSFVKKVETIPIHITLEGEGLTTRRNYHWWKVYVKDSYITNNSTMFYGQVGICIIPPPRGRPNTNSGILRPLHTWEWEPVTITLQTLSLVEKADAVQVRFILNLRDQWSKWMQDGCIFYIDSYMASNVSCFMVTWSLGLFSKAPLWGGFHTKLGDHVTPNAHNHWFMLLFRVWRPSWTEIHWNSIRLSTWSHVTSHHTWGSMTTLHDFRGVWGWPLNIIFWALTISWSRL